MGNSNITDKLIPQGWTRSSRQTKREKKEKDKRDAERRRHDQTAAAFADRVETATSPTVATANQPWYSPESNSSDKIESIGDNLPTQLENEPLSPPLSGQEHETAPASPTSTQLKVVESDQSDTVLPMSLEGEVVETLSMGVGNNVGLTMNMAKGSLPAESNNLNLESGETLRARYLKSEENDTTPKKAQEHQIERRPVGAGSKQKTKRSIGKSAAIETALDDTTPGPGLFSSPVPLDLSKTLHTIAGSPKGSEGFSDKLVGLSNQIQEHENGEPSKCESNLSKGIDETETLIEREIERFSNSDKLLTNEVNVLRGQLRKEIQRVKQLELERERDIGLLDGTKSTMKVMYEQQLLQEQTAHTTTKQQHREKLQELVDQHNSEEVEMQDNMFKQKKKFEAELYNKKKRHENTLKILEEEYEIAWEKVKAELNSEKETHFKAIQDLERKHATEIQRVKESLEQQLESVRGEFDKFKVEKAEEIQTMITEKQRAVQLEKEISQKQVGLMKEEHERLKRENANDIQTLKKEQDQALRLEKENSQTQIRYMNGELERFKAEKSHEIQTLKREQDQVLSLEKENAQKLLTDMSSTLAQLKGENATKIKSLQHQQNIDMQRASELLQQQTESLRNENRQLTLRKDKEIATTRDIYEAKIVKMSEDNERDKVNQFRQLVEDNEALKRLLFKRDNFKAMTDNDLEDRFGAIRHEVDEVARVEWNKLFESRWPLSEKLMQQSKIKRVAKQHLIQNSLWFILYEKIFCTPFRVLGSEGRVMERKWIHQFGQISNSSEVPCPRATKESEKWRCDIIAKCVRATKVPSIDSEPIKNEYEATLKEVTDELFQELERVATVRDIEDQGIDKQRVNELVRNAANLWLEIGQQRFRTKLVMSKSGERPVQSRQTALSPNGTLNLVIFPELRRLGNAQGEQLDHEELIMGCKGNFSVFRTR